MLRTNTHLYFFDGIYSNWSYSKFEWKGQLFCNSEAAMMWGKAKLHKEEATANSILLNQDPKSVKLMGRAMPNFNYKLWEKYKFAIMVDILHSKFSQNNQKKQQLLMTNDLVLVEASPYDKIWGVGLGENDPKIQDKANWLGRNLLGYALMEARKRIKANPTAIFMGKQVTGKD